MSEARAHHYLPQCYLKGFTEAGRKDAKLFAVDWNRGRSFTTVPRNVAVERDFNAIEGRPPGELERALSGFERMADDAIRRIDAAASFHDRDSWGTVLNLLALMAVRGPAMRETFNDFKAQVVRMVAKMTVSTPERFQSTLASAQRAGHVRPDHAVTYERMKAYVEGDRYTVRIPRAHSIAVEMKAHDEVLQTMAARNWTLLIAGEGAGHFITSDQPIILYETRTNSFAMPAMGFGLKNTLVLVPITKRLFAVGEFNGPEGTRVANEAAVAYFNGIVAVTSRQQVYSPTNTFNTILGGKLVSSAHLSSVLRMIRRG